MGAHGTFSGEPQTLWLTDAGKPDRRMKLLEAFAFTDPDDREWPVPACYDRMDGASIPRPLWSIVGSPYTGDYRRASIVHDYYCDLSEHDPPARREADRMFFHACREGGCNIFEATILYLAVRIGAILPLSRRWRAVDSEGAHPRLHLTYEDKRLIDDFQAIADDVLREGETDDPRELEDRVDRVLRAKMATANEV